jgi:hypothetical protein
MLLGLWAGCAKRSNQLLVLVVLVVYAVAIPGPRTLQKISFENGRILDTGQWLASNEDHAPIVVDGLNLFMKLHHYGPAPVKTRLRFLADPHRERRYTGETMGTVLLLWNDWFRLPVVEYSQFISSVGEFWLLSEHSAYWSESQWLTKALLDDKQSFALVGERGVYLQFRVKPGTNDTAPLP